MTDRKIDWFDDFVGLGYQSDYVGLTIFLILDGRRKLVNTWNKIIKYFPDDEIKMRFIEKDSSYEFVLYCQSRILLTTCVFLKSLKISENYLMFKKDYDGAATFKLALYVPKKGSYQLEIFKYSKRVTNVKFLTESEAEEDFILSRSIQNLRKLSEE
ncbi:MAG: hypothetical protein ACREAN_08175 [Nitrosopumilaceae archaeon]